MIENNIDGVYVASLTPFDETLKLDLDGLIKLLSFYAKQGCHGALLLGTTGEGTSLDSKTRKIFWKAAYEIKQDFPSFRLLAGTGTPSLNETIDFNKFVFDLGYDGVVVLPPYYLRNVSDQGLYRWFTNVIESSVPSDGNFLGYHIPQVSRVGLSIELLLKLRDSFPNQFVGVKDSTGDIDHAKKIVDSLPDFVTLVGNDKLLLPSLEFGASGCITAGANISSLLLRRVWDDFQKGDSNQDAQQKINLLRDILDKHKPYPSSLKAMVNHLYNFPLWNVLPPLENYQSLSLQKSINEINKIYNNE
jgi:4-hydroxy-tetrahydrodipicolinate synthase